MSLPYYPQASNDENSIGADNLFLIWNTLGLWNEIQLNNTYYGTLSPNSNHVFQSLDDSFDPYTISGDSGHYKIFFSGSPSNMGLTKNPIENWVGGMSPGFTFNLYGSSQNQILVESSLLNYQSGERVIDFTASGPFKVVVGVGWEGTGFSSSSGIGYGFVAVKVTDTPSNESPTLTSFTSTIASGNEDNPITVTFDNLKAQGNEADLDGTVTAFVVNAVSTGSLKIGTSTGTATAWNADTNNTIDATHQAYWRPAANANGTLNAFAAVSKDNGGLLSATPIQAKINVSPIRDDLIINGTLGNDTLTGDTIDSGSYDTLNGLAGNDILNGLLGNDTLNGGTGADIMKGGNGSDTYLVDNSGDVVIETSTLATEIDTVNSSITYTLGTNVEKLTLTGTAALNGTGNALNNTLTGNAGANTLKGLAGNDILNGGAGADTLTGGLGNDSYSVDNLGDKVIETSILATEIDTVNSSITYTLGANVEKMTLTGAAVINGTGNALNNTLTGNASANILSGLAGNDSINGAAGNDLLIGGAGKDTLTGGIGKDTFDFNAYSEMGLGTSNRDVITDFTRGQDKIDLSTIDPNSALAGNQAFKFITTTFNAPGYIHYSNGIISLNTDSDSATEYEIQLTGVKPTALSATDFVL